jgi:GTP cyclohydrolase I
MSARPALHLTPSEPDPETPEDQRTLVVAARFRDVMQALGLDLEDPNLVGTPLRVARAYGELFAGLDPVTEQVIELLDRRLRPAGAMVVVQARHMCMEMRGVGQPGATTRTSAWRGAFADARTRQEFLDLLPTSAP